MELKFDEGDGILDLTVGAKVYRLDIGPIIEKVEPVVRPWYNMPVSLRPDFPEAAVRKIIEGFGVAIPEAAGTFVRVFLDGLYGADDAMKKKLGIYPAIADGSASPASPPASESGKS